MNEESKEMSTKSKINSLINDIQNKLNKRTSHNYMPNMPYNPSNNRINNYVNNNLAKVNSNYNNNYYVGANQNFPYQQQNAYNPGLNEYEIRNIIKEEFSNLILPYQKDLIMNKNNFDTKLNEVENKFEIIINAQNMGNLNDNAKLISSYLSSNLSNENSKKNFEKIKNEFDNKFEDLEKKYNSILTQIKIINDDKMKNKENFENIGFKIENIIKLLDEKEDKDINKDEDNKIYLEKNIFDTELIKINQKINDTNKGQNQNIQKLNEQIDNMTRQINQYKIEINKISNLDSNLNSMRGDFGKITEDISSLKYQISPEMMNKINSIDFNKLKQQVPLMEFNKLKNDINNFENNFYSVKNISENNDRNISELMNQINNIEQEQNTKNKNVEDRINNKIKELNDKIEEMAKKQKQKEAEEKKEENIFNNEEEKKEGEHETFIGSSRRQQRNSKSINASVNNNNKNINLDEKSLNLIKQLEKINLDELQKMNFNNLLNQIGDLSRENKILSDKIEEQNKAIAEINEKINNMNLKNIKEKDIMTNINEFKINDIYQKNSINLNEPKVSINNEKNKFTPKKESFVEDDYDDFDKDFNSNKKENIKEKEKEKEIIISNNNEINNNKFNLLEDKNARDNIIKKSKNEFGSFSKYSEVNILDQIMGVGDRGKKPGLENGFSEQKFGGGSTFITGSMTENKNKKINLDEKPKIFEEENKIENNKAKEMKDDKDKKEENNVDDDDNFDDFDIDEI